MLQLVLDVCDTQSNRFQRWYSIYSWRLDFGYPYELFTDLIVASYFGLGAMVKLLLEQGDIELSFKDNRGRTALS